MSVSTSSFRASTLRLVDSVVAATEFIVGRFVEVKLMNDPLFCRGSAAAEGACSLSSCDDRCSASYVFLNSCSCCILERRSSRTSVLFLLRILGVGDGGSRTTAIASSPEKDGLRASCDLLVIRRLQGPIAPPPTVVALIATFSTT